MPVEPAKCSYGCCRTSTSLWYRVLKLFLVVAVLLLVFSAGAASVVVGRGGRSGVGMRGWNTGMMKGVPEEGMMARDGVYPTTAVLYKRMFGTITKIEGNMITVADNAAMQDVLLSKQQTIIVANGAEIGLSGLKVGQNIVAVYRVNDAGQMEAQTMSVQ